MTVVNLRDIFEERNMQSASRDEGISTDFTESVSEMSLKGKSSVCQVFQMQGAV